MRHLDSFTDPQQAQRFTSYLITRGVVVQLEEEDGHWAVWVRDENDLDRARAELAEFRQAPDDPRYTGLQRQAESIVRSEQAKREQARRNVIEMRRRWTAGAAQRRPVVIVMIVLSILVTLAIGFGSRQQLVWRQLLFCSLESYNAAGENIWADIVRGQLWRLVTPMFLHFSMMHLAFNMFMLYQFGVIYETRRGSLRTLGLILALSAAANVAQALGPETWGPLRLGGGTPRFGGMSGVVYGLFGYLWMKSHLEPSFGVRVPGSTVVILLGWFFLCMTDLINIPVANLAHGGGLALGMILGSASYLYDWLLGKT